MQLLLFFICSGVVCGKLHKTTSHLRFHNVKSSDALRDSETTEDISRERKRYKPDWDDLDKRPLPQWYDAAKIGIFVHWGVYSVPSYHSEWFWKAWKSGDKKITNFMEYNYPPGFTYQDFAPMLTAEFFDPMRWARLFKKAGAKYVVLTSKHHEGFTLFPSSQSFSWNSVDLGPHFDVVGHLSKAVKDQGLEFGVYYSLYEWFNPIYWNDSETDFKTRVYPDTKVWPEIKQLINNYLPSILWSDGDWDNSDTYWNSTGLLSWLYNDSPVRDHIVVNDRWGRGTLCRHGDFYNCVDRYNPKTLQKHKWENAFTLDEKSWGYRRNMDLSELLTMEEVIENLVTTVSCGGNVLINVGPTKEGTISPIFQLTLTLLGEWLTTNGKAIYDTSPWVHQNDTHNSYVWYTCLKNKYNGAHPTAIPNLPESVDEIYAIFLKWPVSNVLKLRAITSELHMGRYQVEMLGYESNYLSWKIVEGETRINLPSKSTVRSSYAWTLRFYPKQ